MTARDVPCACKRLGEAEFHPEEMRATAGRRSGSENPAREDDEILSSFLPALFAGRCDPEKATGKVCRRNLHSITAMAASIITRLSDIEEQIDGAAEQLESDPAISPALKAVFDELHRKTREARDTLKGADEDKIRERVIEVEQAADSAKCAAEADQKISRTTRDAVIEIHDALCELKGELGD